MGRYVTFVPKKNLEHFQTITGKSIQDAARYILDGEVVAIPTETVYGLAANALNEEAVTKVFKAKNRPYFDPLIVHCHSIEQVSELTDVFPNELTLLAKLYWPGPLTLLLPKKNIIPDIVTSGLPRVGVRIPSHTLTLDLLRTVNVPLAAPSANPFGYVSPTTAKHVNDQLSGKIPYILNGGDCTVGLESTIVGIEDKDVCIYRLGGLKTEIIKQHFPNVKLKLNQGDNPAAPGMLSSHYSPGKKMYLGNISQLWTKWGSDNTAVISLGPDNPATNEKFKFVLSQKSDLDEAAAKIFSVLRTCDREHIHIIIAEWMPEQGLGTAINDRLKRAANYK